MEGIICDDDLCDRQSDNGDDGDRPTPNVEDGDFGDILPDEGDRLSDDGDQGGYVGEGIHDFVPFVPSSPNANSNVDDGNNGDDIEEAGFSNANRFLSGDECLKSNYPLNREDRCASADQQPTLSISTAHGSVASKTTPVIALPGKFRGNYNRCL